MESRTEAEPFYASLAYDLEDIICEGSDSEQTQADISAKRIRYEEQASRICHGHVPMILSATLKGPFDREHGWINPWKERTQYQSHATSDPRKVLRPDARVRRRGKGTAPARSREHGNRADDIIQPSEVRSTTSQLQDVDSPSCSRAQINPKSTRSNYQQGTPISKEQERSRRLSMGAATSHLTGYPERDSRVWLKGSYVSRTARWDQIDAPSPTPVETRPRRRSTSKMTTISATMRSNVPRPNVIRHNQDECPPQGVKRDINEISGDHIYSSSYIVRNSNRNSGSDMNDESAQNLLNAQLHHDVAQNFADQTTSSVDISQGRPSFIMRIEKPDLESDAELENVDEMDVVASFVTELMPSCRDLEKFQFRKRRRFDAAHQSDVESPTLIKDAIMCDPISLGSFSVEHSTATYITTSQSPSTPELPTVRLPSAFDKEDDADWETTLGEGHVSAATFGDAGSPKSTSSVVPGIEGSFYIGQLSEDNEWNTTFDESSPVKSVGQSSQDIALCSARTRGHKSPEASEAILSRLEAVKDHASSLYFGFESSTITRPSENSYPAPTIRHDTQRAYVLQTSLGESHISDFEAQDVGVNSMTDENDISTQSANTTPSRTLIVPRVIRAEQADHALASDLRKPVQNDGLSMKDVSFEAQKTSSPRAVRCLHTYGLSARSIANEALKDFSPLQLDLHREERSNMLPELNNSPFIVFKLFQTLPSNSKALDQSPERAKSAGVEVLPPILSYPAPMLKSRTRTKSAASQSAPLGTAAPADIDKNPDIMEGSSSQQRVEDNLDRSDVDSVASISITPLSQGLIPMIVPMIVPIEKSSAPTAASKTPQASLKSDTSNNEDGHHVERVIEQGQSDGQATTSNTSGTSDTNNDGEESFMLSLVTTPTLDVTTQSPWHQDKTRVDVVSSPFDGVATVSKDNQDMAVSKEDTVPNEREQSQWQEFEPVAITTAITKSLSIDSPARFGSPTIEPIPSAATKSLTPVTNSISQNPWASTRKISHTKKIKKRVSFGVAVDTQETHCPQTPQPAIRVNSPQDSPDIDYNEDQGVYTARRIITLPAGTRDCFTTVKPFKRILPNKSASQINSSPAAIDAMAEAFVAADVDMPVEEERPNTSRGLLCSPMSLQDSSWAGTKGGITPMGDISDDQENADLDYDVPGFNIDEALGEFGEFLEDWSVEAEIKKVREEEKALKTNPIRKSRYFGMT